MRVLVVGGFLGAGKTTLIRGLAGHLRSKGERVAIVTNDQGHSLVDTRLCQTEADAVDEITGGCFCCRFAALEDALSEAERAAASVVIAEAVGSCTDLVATVLSPLAQRWPTLELAPLTIVVDPWRVGEMENSSTPADISYLFGKQIQEADVVVLSRADLGPPDVRETIRRRAPHAAVVRSAPGSFDSLERVLGAMPDRPAAPLDIDYGRYGHAESLLGWSNGIVRLESERPFRPSVVVERFLSGLRDEPVAHVKVATLEPAGGSGSLVRRGADPVLEVADLPDHTHRMRMLVNARVALSPADLERRLHSALANLNSGTTVTWEEFDCFEPAAPSPTHRHTFRCGSGDDASCCAAFYDRSDVRQLLGDSLHPGGLELTLKVAECLGLAAGGSVLDVACGGGVSLRAIQSRWPAQVVGLDASADGPSSRPDFVQAGDAHALPFNDGAFDAVLCECALSTFADQQQALAEIHRVLSPGGRVGLSDMMVEGLIPEPLRDWIHLGTCLEGAAGFDDYSALLEQAGLVVVERWRASSAMHELIRRLKRNLVGLAFSQAAGSVPPELQVDVSQARELLTVAETAVADGVIGYGVWIAERSSDTSTTNSG